MCTLGHWSVENQLLSTLHFFLLEIERQLRNKNEIWLGGTVLPSTCETLGSVLAMKQKSVILATDFILATSMLGK